MDEFDSVWRDGLCDREVVFGFEVTLYSSYSSLELHCLVTQSAMELAEEHSSGEGRTSSVLQVWIEWTEEGMSRGDEVLEILEE